MPTDKDYPILNDKDYDAPSIFNPANLLREARRQKNIRDGSVPDVCVLDPDGDIVDYLKRTNNAEPDASWACYHTSLYRFVYSGRTMGIIGNAVGASFAVLLAEQLFVSGCRLLISITSAGIINTPPNNARFTLIKSSLRDEGTSYHYIPPDQPSVIHEHLFVSLSTLFGREELSLQPGTSWTTDAPYRETEKSIGAAKQKGIISVEMEASALYAFAIARKKDVVCYAHLTNTMARNGDDFEKGAENGSIESLNLIHNTVSQIIIK